MNPDVGLTDAIEDREARLVGLIDELTARLRRGEPADVEAAARAHPDLADELRGLWGALLLAEELARPDPADVPTPALGPLPAHGPVAGFVGECELMEEIGRGGMGVVYRARQARLGRTVAVKMLPGGGSASALDMARFRAEAESAARLDHPHIVPVYGAGEHDGRPYFLMRLIDGTTLARRLADGPLPPREAARLLAPVCRAIDHAHRAGVLHRDIKPSNILIDRDGVPHVGDFGLAKRIDADAELTRSGAVVGTPAYMAPELARGLRGRIGPAADVYSLGATLYHMLTGRPPFQAASVLDVLQMVREQDPVPPRVLNPSVDRDLEMIALKCLQKPPDLRYPTAAALADDLDAYLAGEPISARSSTLAAVAVRLLGETHHAAVLENWGLLWMWHSLVVLVMCVLTNAFMWWGLDRPGPHLLLWTVGLGAWAAVFWSLRRRAGPVTFVERQIAHIWAGSVISCVLLYVVEMLMGLPVLTLSPVLGLIGGLAFTVKAGILSGSFYFQAALLFLSAGIMALVPEYGLTVFGVVSAVCYFLPGWKYYRQRSRMLRRSDG